MKKISLFYLFILVLGFHSCSNKSSTNSPEPEKYSDKDSVVSKSVEDVHIQHDITIQKPYPAELQGIWGNTRYLENLKKYNSVGKVLEHMKFDTEIKINRNMALIMRPQYMEPSELDSIKYILIKAGTDSLYVRSRNSGEKQLYVKLMSLPDTVLWNLYDDERYSAISILEWQWFQGKYNLTDKKGKKTEVSFNLDGSVEGMDYQFYSFGIDVDGKDFLYLRAFDDEYLYLLIEHQPNALYNCYNVEDVDDWEYPFIKTSLAFKLQKVE